MSSPVHSLSNLGTQRVAWGVPTPSGKVTRISAQGGFRHAGSLARSGIDFIPVKNAGCPGYEGLTCWSGSRMMCFWYWSSFEPDCGQNVGDCSARGAPE